MLGISTLILILFSSNIFATRVYFTCNHLSVPFQYYEIEEKFYAADEVGSAIITKSGAKIRHQCFLSDDLADRCYIESTFDGDDEEPPRPSIDKHPSKDYSRPPKNVDGIKIIELGAQTINYTIICHDH
uniref:Uncharacterized protein n=1 Tax=Panagrolaimus sp. ES5 TaxID=591445 RepID=A0AC34FRX4_9BILA